jgi:glucan 1,3-beta-glucosidase
MPTDPREAVGACGNTNPWTPPLQPWQTGGAGAGQIPASVTSNLAWPPASISNAGAVTALPSYVPSGNPKTLPVPTFTRPHGSKQTGTIDAGNGWANQADNTGMHLPVPTCNYLDPWVGPTVAPPVPLCSGGSRRSEAEESMITSAP